MANNASKDDPSSIFHVRCQCGELYHIASEHLCKRIRCIKCKSFLVLPLDRQRGDSRQSAAGIPTKTVREHFIEKVETSRIISLNWNILQFAFAAVIILVFVVVIFTYSPERASSDQANENRATHPDIVVQSPETKTLRQIESYPIQYALGSFDDRFGITKDRVLDLIYQAKDLWEIPTGMSLFRYDPSASFRINLVFDDREQRRIDERRLKNQIDATGKSFNDLKQEYDSNRDQKNELEYSYNNRVFIFKKNMDRHKSRVGYWNDKGGAPADEYTALQQEEADLNKTAESLERERTVLNEVIDKVNRLGGEVNELINRYNFQIADYNGQFVGSREFEKGLFDGKEINIYEFDDESDLKATLVHELGHALGFAHVDDPTAIMYYKLEKQDLRSLHLTPADLELLRHKFPGTAMARSN